MQFAKIFPGKHCRNCCRGRTKFRLLLRASFSHIFSRIKKNRSIVDGPTHKKGEQKCRVSHRGDFSTIAECLKMQNSIQNKIISPPTLRTTIFIRLHKARFHKIHKKCNFDIVRSLPVITSQWGPSMRHIYIAHSSLTHMHRNSQKRARNKSVPVQIFAMCEMDGRSKTNLLFFFHLGWNNKDAASKRSQRPHLVTTAKEKYPPPTFYIPRSRN